MRDERIYKQRNRDLQKVYTRIKTANGVNFQYLKRNVILQIIAEEPAPRFYLTPEYAARYINAYYKKGDTGSFEKKQMILELVERFEKYKRLYPDFARWKLYDMVVNSPARSFYMTPQRIKEVLFNYTGRNGNKK